MTTVVDEMKSVSLLGRTVSVPAWIELPLTASNRRADFEVRIGEATPSSLSFDVDDAVALHVDREQRRVLVEPRADDGPAELGPRALEHYLIDHAVPTAVCEFGGIGLHCGGVAMNDSAVLLLGASGAGKSTAVALLETLGWRAMGDDSIAASQVGDQWMAWPSYRGVRLHPEGLLDHRLEGRHNTSIVAEYANKVRTQSAAHDDWSDNPVPLSGIVVLGNDAPFATRLIGAGERCARLADQLFFAPGPPSDAPRRLQRVAPVAAEVSGFVVDYPRTPDGVDDLDRFLRASVLA